MHVSHRKVLKRELQRASLIIMTASAQLGLMVSLVLNVGLTSGLEPNQRMGFTFRLPAGGTECFYQTATRDDSMEIEYQVNKTLF